jgi:RNA polymerase sigma factor (sigma-70 family)
MVKLDYDGLVEPWKVDLIIARAKRMGFRCEEIEDVQQELILDVMSFRYETAKSNGASETTALIALIDNRLKKLVRAQVRYRAHVDQFREEAERSYEPVTCDRRAIHVNSVVAALAQRERAVCRALGFGLTSNEIAKSLGCGWYTVDRIVARIRQRFEECGLDAWMRD